MQCAGSFATARAGSCGTPGQPRREQRADQQRQRHQRAVQPTIIRFAFAGDGVRYRPTLRWEPTEANLRRVREHLRRIEARIAAGTFCFAEEFPDFRGLQKLPLPLREQTCFDVFDAFLPHEETRVTKGDLALATLASRRHSLDRVWRPAIGALPLW